MALNNPSTLAFPPIETPLVNTQSGKMTPAWAMWFQQMYVRIGDATPVDPTISTISLILGKPYDFYIVPNGQTVVWNGTTYTQGKIVPFYISGVSASTIIDSFTVRNTSLVAGVINVWVVPYANIPSAKTLVVNNFPLPANSAAVELTQLTGTEFGSAGYLAVTVSPSQQIICDLRGRVLT